MASAPKLSDQMLRRNKPAATPEHAGNEGETVSTGSTLLDLAISGGRYPHGGLPGGVLVEIFGPSATGKTVLLSEIAGSVQRHGGEVQFKDPEGRLNKQFAALFGFNVENADYSNPDTVLEVFGPIRDWEPDSKGGKINGIFADSLAALSTEMELEKDDGDKMGMRRAKEFSQELRKICRLLPERNLLMVCSNQVRVNPDAGQYGQKYRTPGGEAIGFYSSVRLRTSLSKKIKQKRKVRGVEHEYTSGVEIEVEVFKNSVDKAYRKAPLIITFDYGVDDVRANLQWLKTNTSKKVYTVGEHELGISLEGAAEQVEEKKLEKHLRREVTKLWREIEGAFSSSRRKRRE